ncbi:MAG: hypothetical protein LBR85_07345 [Oscillospiraceae bacterium]|jgi:hypothetical protein|nr:hypothetical protein [Oscillospiraceae bacterium]
MEILDSLEWRGNSRAMYEEILKNVPSLFAGRVKRDIAAWAVKNNIHTVTEDIVFRAVDEIAPADMANKRIKPALEKLRSR